MDLEEKQSFYGIDVQENADIQQSHNFEENQIDEDNLSLSLSDIVLKYKNNQLQELGSNIYNLLNDILQKEPANIDILTNNFLKCSLLDLLFDEEQIKQFNQDTEKEIFENMSIQNNSINDYAVFYLLRQRLQKIGIDLMIENNLDIYFQNQKKYLMQLKKSNVDTDYFDIFNMNNLHYLASDISIEQFELKIKLDQNDKNNQGFSFGQLVAENYIREQFLKEWETLLIQTIGSILSQQSNKEQISSTQNQQQQQQQQQDNIYLENSFIEKPQTKISQNFQIIWTKLKKQTNDSPSNKSNNSEIISLFFYIPMQYRNFYKDLQVELQSKLKQARSDFVELNIHNLFNICLICTQFLDKWVQIKFKSTQQQLEDPHQIIPEMGGYPYYQPQGWILYGIKKSENKQPQDELQSNAFAYAELNYVRFNNIYFDQLEDVGNNRNDFEDKVCGHGIVLYAKADDLISNFPVTINYCGQKQNYLIKLMVTVNPKKIRVPKGYEDRVYIVNDPSYVQVYGLLVKHIKN